MELRELVKQKIAEAAGVKPADIKLEHPEREEFGDYSTNIALILKGGRPLAEKIAAAIKEDEVIKKAEVAGGGFINIWLQSDVVSKEIERVIKEGEGYGSKKNTGETWLLEHTSPNPNKAMHLGHLRNNLVGMALGNLWEFMGTKVIRDAVDNDRGIAIARLMWGYLKFARKDKQLSLTGVDYWYKHQDEWLTPVEAGQRPDRFVDELYVKASEDFKNPDVEANVRKLVVEWENKEPHNRALWENVMAYSHQGQEMTLKRLGSKWDWVWHEHDHYELGKQIVDEGLKKGVFRESEGAMVTDLAKYGLPDTVVIKSDGTALYMTQDLALTRLKREKFHPDKMFWVIGPEQTLQMKQLFALCEQLGFGKTADYTHIAFGWMSIKGQGKMSSRAGNVIYIDGILDLAKEEIKKRITDRKLSSYEAEEIAEKVGVGAVKYSVLKVGRLQDTAFDLEESISFDGNSGPYLQYTYARTRSVLAKSQISLLRHEASEGQANYQFNAEEMAVLRYIYRFPEAVAEAAERYSPNLVCNFLYELAQRFNSFYNQHSILSADNDEAKNFRLGMTMAVGQVLKNGLNLLGIEAPERM